MKARSLKNKGVLLRDPVNRKKLFKKIESSRVFLYKGSKDETFCMALAESQLLGVPAIVCDFGCMNERVINNKTGYVCKNDSEFCSRTVDLLQNDRLWSKMNKESLKKKKTISIGMKWQKMAKNSKLKILNMVRVQNLEVRNYFLKG